MTAAPLPSDPDIPSGPVSPRWGWGRAALLPLLHLFLLLSASVPSRAGLFNKGLPVPGWGLEARKVHTPDYARDASSIVLYDEYVETIDSQGRAVEREREAIRILRPQGRGATCEVAYGEDERINYFRAWTIAADEKTYQAQESDFTEIGDTSDHVMLSTERVRVVHLPAIDVGAVEICESEEVLAPYIQEKSWHIESGVPVVFEALEVDLPPGRGYTAAWHNHAAVGPAEAVPGHPRWELRDVPALELRDVSSHPDREALTARMSVQWGTAAVPGVDSQWRAIGLWISALEAGRPSPSPEITAAVQSLIAGAPDLYTRLSRITESIQREIRYFVVIRGIGGLQAHPAAEIFRNRYGDCKDKTTLLISMLEVAGVHAYYLPVDTRRGVVDPRMPTIEGNHMIAAIEMPEGAVDPRLQAVVKGNDGRRYLIFDPTDERTPVGNLRPELQGGYGILSAGERSQILALPVLDPGQNGNELKGVFALAGDGTLTGTVDSVHTGPDGAEWRDFLKGTDERERRHSMETRVARDLPGVVLASLEFVQPHALDQPLRLAYKVTVPSYAHPAGPLLLLRPRVVGTDNQAFDDRPRTVPIVLGATGRWRDSFDITLPPGYVVDETPEPVDIDLDFASYHSSVRARDNTLHYEREFIVRSLELAAGRVADYRRLEGSILEDERSTAVLKRQ